MSQDYVAREKTAIAERVDAGIDWLDKRDRNWRSRVNRTTLDLSKPTQCILAHIFGSWLNTTLTRTECIQYGFLAPDGLTGFEPEPHDYRSLYYEALTIRWRLII